MKLRSLNADTRQAGAASHSSLESVRVPLQDDQPQSNLSAWRRSPGATAAASPVRSRGRAGTEHASHQSWSVNPLDWKRTGASVITQRILSDAQSGAIILSHDIRQKTIDAMPAILDALLAKGYKFVTVSQLIAMNHPKAPSPPVAVSRTPQQ